jgi:hypothetical protein
VAALVKCVEVNSGSCVKDSTTPRKSMATMPMTRSTMTVNPTAAFLAGTLRAT